MKRPTRLDGSRRTVVAWCSACPPWRYGAETRPEALRAAAVHLEQVHGVGDTPEAAKARSWARELRDQSRRIETRHADRPWNGS